MVLIGPSSLAQRAYIPDEPSTWQVCCGAVLYQRRQPRVADPLTTERVRRQSWLGDAEFLDSSLLFKFLITSVM